MYTNFINFDKQKISSFLKKQDVSQKKTLTFIIFEMVYLFSLKGYAIWKQFFMRTEQILFLNLLTKNFCNKFCGFIICYFLYDNINLAILVLLIT